MSFKKKKFSKNKTGIIIGEKKRLSLTGPLKRLVACKNVASLYLVFVMLSPQTSVFLFYCPDSHTAKQ